MNQFYLQEILDYCPLTGEFTWLNHPNFKCKNGTRADIPRLDGYKTIQIDSKPYYAHRLAFIYMLDTLPSEVDHINRDVGDNRWANLRECTSRENSCNSAIPRHNTTGLKNISDNSKKSSKRPWRVSMKIGTTVVDKTFENIEDAIEYADSIRVHLHKDFACSGF
jgi:hypothetical protein